MRRNVSSGYPWWRLLMREYGRRNAKGGMSGTESRLGLAHLAAARSLLFGCPQDAEDCLNEIRRDTTGLVLGFWCESNCAPMLGFDQYGCMRNEYGFRPFASLTQEWGEQDIDRVCARLVEDAEALLQAGTPSRQPSGLRGSIPAAFTTDDLQDIEAVRRMLNDE